MRRLLAVSVSLFLPVLFLGGACMRATPGTSGPATTALPSAGAVQLPAVTHQAVPRLAALADKGNLVGYLSQPARHPTEASTWYRADVSEDHALRAVASGEMTVASPQGRTVRLQYHRHLEHANGNWTWIGRNEKGEEAVLTFGEKAVFGVLPDGDGNELALTTLGGRTWVVKTDPSKQLQPVGDEPDYVVPPELAVAAAAAEQYAESAPATSAAATATAVPTVDLAVGYTTGFASELGGDSQAVTRVQHLIDVNNQAYANSQINAQVRLVRVMPVNYVDNTDNNDTLYKLSGRTGSGTTLVDPAFTGLRAARDQYGADLVSLVRRFRTPENQGCGVAWLLGGGLTRIDSSDAPYGYSVVSDDLDRGDRDETDGKNYGCRKETMAHELGHNLGQAHNVEDSDGDPGAHTYSYGYRESSTTGFYTVMAYRLPNSSQTAIRYFANPNVVDAATGRPTGVANSADNARSMIQTIPLVATFRATVVPPPATRQAPNLYSIAKLGGSGFTEMHVLSGAAAYSAFQLQTPTSLGRTGTSDVWQFTLGDRNRDGVADLYSVYRQGGSGRTELYVLDGAQNYRASLLQIATALQPTGTGLEWDFAMGDYNRDGVDDLYAIYRTGLSGMTEVHVLDGANLFQSYLAHIATALGQTGNTNAWTFDLADRNGDGVLDLYCINRVGVQSTEVHVLDGARSFQAPLLQVGTVLPPTGTSNAWDFKVGDYNGDGAPDLYAIYRIGSSGRTELYVLDGAASFSRSAANIATALLATGTENSWEFELWPK